MRLFIGLFFITFMLEAMDKESCYTVQLFSLPSSDKNKESLKNEKFHTTCKTMKIGTRLTVRCGCYGKMKGAEELLPTLDKKYKNAYIASTYKYRFDDNFSFIRINQKKLKKNTKKKQIVSSEEEELKIMLQTFLYTNDLEYAYKAAKLGYKQRPNSYYWNQKLSEIAQWTGRAEEAIKYMRYMYSVNKTKKIEKQLIDYGLGAYQYENIEYIVYNQVQREPTKENIAQMVFIYDKIGTPEKSAQILLQLYKKDPTKHDYLTKALQIYIDMGELEEAQVVINLIDKSNKYTVEDVKLISYFYYLKRDIKNAYNILLVDFEGKKDIKYNTLVTDLGWYVEEYKKAAEASFFLIKKDKARLVDYERVIHVNKNKANSKSLDASLLAYEKFKLSYLFYSYSTYALRDKKYDGLKRIIYQVDQSDSNLKNDAKYWLLKSQVAKHYNDTKASKFALSKALELSPNSLQTQLTAISLYITYNMQNELRELLQSLAQGSNIDNGMNYTLASSYFYIYDINRAAYYADKLLQSDSSIVDSIDFKFLQADIYSMKNNHNAFMTKMREIKFMIEKKALENPKILEEDRTLNNYLRASMYIMHIDDFAAELLLSKSYLSEYNYDNLSYAFAMRKGAQEEAHVIYQRTRRKEPWLRLTNAMKEQEHSNIQDLLQRYLKLLPLGDASQAAHNDGQVALSQSIAYKALELNDDNQNAYIQHLGLVRERTDEFGSKLAYLIRDPLVRKYMAVDNSLYMQEGLYFLTGVNYYLNSRNDGLLLSSVPNNSLDGDVSLKQILKRGFIEASVGYASSLDSYMYGSIKGAYQINNYFTVSSKIAKNVDAEESPELLLGGKKDMLSFGFLWNIMPSTSLEILYENNQYSSQDDAYIGKGDYFRTILGHQIRNGYPDMRIGVFYDRGSYQETLASRGIIDTLQVQRNPVLPKDFYNAGLTFAYGMANSNLYTRVWRPYFDINTYYNSDTQAYSYGINVGYGGKVFQQDHMTVGASYSESVYGDGGKVFELFLNYRFMYIHPEMF